MDTRLNGKRVAFLATDGVEQSELVEPWKAVEDAGGQPTLVSLKHGRIQLMQHDEKADTRDVDVVVDDARPDGFDALVLPGGVANPDALRQSAAVVSFVKNMMDARKPVAVICHGPWTLIEADVVRGRTLTSWPSLRTDLTNAGAHWVDEEVHVDNGLVSSRKPDDLPAFCSKMIEEIAEGVHQPA